MKFRFLLLPNRLAFRACAQHGVQWTGGYAPRFQAFFAALGFSRFDADSQSSHLPLTRAVGRIYHPMAWLIVVTGRPVAGKSTLADWIGRQLAIPVISKDPIKEILFNELGWRDREWSKTIGRSSVEVMFHIAHTLLKSGQSVILDNAFHAELASPALRTFAQDTQSTTLQIICRADPQVLFRRFKSRAESGLRHPGHVDAQSLDELKSTLEQERPLRLDVGGAVIEVDTSDFAHARYESVLQQAKAIMGDTG